MDKSANRPDPSTPESGAGQIPELLATAIDTVARRSMEKARDLKVDGRMAPLQRIAAREKHLGVVLAGIPATLVGRALKAVEATGANPDSFALEPFHVQLLSGYDALCKQLLQLPAPQLGKLTNQQSGPLAESRTRLKRLGREGRAQLELRLQQHTATVRKAGEQRRAESRLAYEAERQAQRKARLRARHIWIALLLAIVAAMAVVVQLR